MEMAATLPEQAEDEEADQEEVQQPKKPVNFLKANKVIKKKVHKKQNDVSLKPRVPESRMETPEKKPTTKVV
jgi:predicted DNA binding CopG/RHH family protein